MLMGFVGVMLLCSIIILGAWTAADEWQAVTSLQYVSGTQWYVTQCRSSTTAPLLALVVYQLFLMFLGALLAFASRKIAEGLNEAKSISLSIYNFVVTMAIVAPVVYIVNDSPGNITFLIA